MKATYRIVRKAVLVVLVVVITWVCCSMTETKNVYTNRLINEKSPYLLQHAHNPVDWYPWGDEAFEKAKKENKPIFLSIGYSTCHWCHVMEEESFSDEEVARLMNQRFVSIKVDREERPDIDNIYMNVSMAMTGSGGWPLTIIMTPDRKPFFAGTYFPKRAKLGHPGLMDVLEQISNLWGKDPERVIQASEDITKQLQSQLTPSPSPLPQGERVKGGLDKNILQKGYEQLSERFDSQFGGFGTAPKFPAPHNLSFLLRWWKQSNENNALNMVEKTLDNMSRGGMHDHIGSGFHRYATDARWLVPHFEKMLYDQAMLAIAYTEAYQASRNKSYAEVAGDIFEYVLRDMTSPEGGFYSAEDADVEGEEGKFYVWAQEEILKILGKEHGDIFCRFYGVTKDGNFEGGRNVLHIEIPLDAFARKERMEPEALKNILEASRKKLLTERQKRTHPHKDDKILTDWNGLMIAVLAKGAQALDNPEYAKAASRCADFILKNLRRNDGRLLHLYRDGASPLPGYLDDYAFLVWGLIDLYETTFDVRYIKEAISLNDEMLKLFWDKKDGGFFFSGEDNEKLIMNRKDIYDGAIPSGNSVAALNLLRLGRITSNLTLEKKAEELMNAFSSSVGNYPMGYSQLLIALDFAAGPSREIVIAGEIEHQDTLEMLKVIRREFLPRKIVLLHSGGKEGEEIEKIAPFLKEQRAIDGKATAYVCENYACKLPTTNIKELKTLLDIPK